MVFLGILDSNGADASQIAAALKKSARKKRGGIIGGSLPSVGLDQDETQEIIIKDEEPSASAISTPGKSGFWPQSYPTWSKLCLIFPKLVPMVKLHSLIGINKVDV